jgi:hypothetical protein
MGNGYPIAADATLEYIQSGKAFENGLKHALAQK